MVQSTQPQASAAAMFPHAAAANHSIFYDASGRARSVGEVYGKLTRLFDSARAVAFAQGGVTGTGSGQVPVSGVAGQAAAAGAPPLPAARDGGNCAGQSSTERASGAGCICERQCPEATGIGSRRRRTLPE